MRRILFLLGLACTVYAGLVWLLWAFQEQLIYAPTREHARTPEQVGLTAQELSVTTSDGVELHGWRFPRESSIGEVLVCHGNAGNAADRLHSVRAFLDMGLSVTLFDWRGYGKSEGVPSERGLYRDVVAIYGHLTGELGVSPERIVAYGQSLGGGPAIELARNHPLAALVLESTFTSLPEVAAEIYPWLPAHSLTRERYANEVKLPELELPILVVHSPADETVPFAHAEALVAAAPNAELLTTEGGHNAGGFRRRPRWLNHVATFIHNNTVSHTLLSPRDNKVPHTLRGTRVIASPENGKAERRR